MKNKKLLVLATVLKDYGFKNVLGIKPIYNKQKDYDYELVFKRYWFNILIYSTNILSKGNFTKIFIKHFIANVPNGFISGKINILDIYADEDKIKNTFLNNLLKGNLIDVINSDDRTKYLNHIFKEYLHIASGDITSIAKIKVSLDIETGNVSLEFPRYNEGKIQKLLDKKICLGSLYNTFEISAIYRDITFYITPDFNKRYVKYKSNTGE